MYDVYHDKEKYRFFIQQADQECVLDYVVTGNEINFTHTYVPFRLRGQGLAEQLVEVGLKWAKEQGYEIKADCWYVAKFL